MQNLCTKISLAWSSVPWIIGKLPLCCHLLEWFIPMSSKKQGPKSGCWLTQGGCLFESCFSICHGCWHLAQDEWLENDADAVNNYQVIQILLISAGTLCCKKDFLCSKKIHLLSKILCAPYHLVPAFDIVQITLYNNDLTTHSSPFIRLRAPWRQGPAFIFVPQHKTQHLKSGVQSRKWTLNKQTAFCCSEAAIFLPFNLDTYVGALVHHWISLLYLKLSFSVLCWWNTSSQCVMPVNLHRRQKSNMRPIFRVIERGDIHNKTVFPSPSTESKRFLETESC